jgi:hypothetical protein
MGQASRSWMTLNTRTSGRVSVFHLVLDVPPGREKGMFRPLNSA